MFTKGRVRRLLQGIRHNPDRQDGLFSPAEEAKAAFYRSKGFPEDVIMSRILDARPLDILEDEIVDCYGVSSTTKKRIIQSSSGVLAIVDESEIEEC